MADGRRLHLLGEGRLVNLVGRRGPPGRGHGHVVREPGAGGGVGREAARRPRSRAVYPVPVDIDEEVARLKLHAMGVEIDTLTDRAGRATCTPGSRAPDRVTR